MIRVEQGAGSVEVILDRAPVNALDEAMVEGLAEVAAELEGRSDLAVVVVRSAARVFCAGADIKMMAGFLEGDDGPTRLTRYAGRLQAVLGRWASLPVPTVAVVNGVAAGGGLELALACDVRLAGESARLGLPEANLGLLPGAGGTQRLTRTVGHGRALLALLSGDLLDAAEAHAAGLVQEVVADDRLDARADDVVAAIAGRGRELAVEVKRCVASAHTPEGFHAELSATQRLAGLPSTHRLMTEFLDKGRAAR